MHRCLLYLCCLLVFGCASFDTAPKNQSNTFPPMTPIVYDTSVPSPSSNGTSKELKRLGEQFQTVQNGLANITGKLTGIEATTGELNGIKADLSAIKNLDVKGDLAAFKTKFDTNLSATLSTVVDAALYKAQQNQQQGPASVVGGGSIIQTQSNVTKGFVYGLFIFCFLCNVLLGGIVVYLIRGIFRVKNDLSKYSVELTKMKAAAYPIKIIDQEEEVNKNG